MWFRLASLTCKVNLLFLIMFSCLNLSESYKFVNDEFISRKLFPNVTRSRTNLKQNNVQVTQFLDLINNDDLNSLKASQNTPFIIIVPSVNLSKIKKDSIRPFLMEHLIPGGSFNQLKNKASLGNLNGKIVTMSESKSSQRILNGRRIKNIDLSNKLYTFIEIEGTLFSTKSTAEPISQPNNLQHNTKKLVSENFTYSNYKNDLLEFLANNKVGTKVFQHFCNSSNILDVIDNLKTNLTILIPSDIAFQRWHPVDWGFFPFSVPEFTANILKNHFIFRVDGEGMHKKQIYKSIEGETVVFENEGDENPTFNNVSIVANATLKNGLKIFVLSEVLFMTESIVSQLHQNNKDKETPPLLAFPWFASQFLSHAYLTLERDSRFTQITRFLSNSEIANHVTGSNYTFFVPNDDAFEKYELNNLSDEAMKTNKTLNLFLNHFVKQRLYTKDLQNGMVLENINGNKLKIKNKGNVFINQAKIYEFEVFVYNLGTLYFIDDILFPELLIGNKTTNKDIDIPVEIDENSSYEDSYTTETPIDESLNR